MLEENCPRFQVKCIAFENIKSQQKDRNLGPALGKKIDHSLKSTFYVVD
jgi:hypothetical protein